MSMFDRVLAVTNRKLCQGDFLTQIERIAAAHPAGLVLREKDLDENAYRVLAGDVLRICDAHGVPCMLHRFDAAARALGCPRIHLPLPYLLEYPQAAQGFETVGVSVHSADEAIEAVRLGATYLTAGHVFLTDCKKVSRHAAWTFCAQSAMQCPSRSMPSAVSPRRTRPTVWPLVRQVLPSCRAS